MSNFWDNPAYLSPKQADRWIIHFGADGVFYYAKSVDRPSYSLNNIKGKLLYSHQVNFPGRLTWNPIKITLYDVQSSEKEGLISQTPSGLNGRTVDTSALFSTQHHIDKKILNSGYTAPDANLGAIFKQTLNTQIGVIKIIELGSNSRPSIKHVEKDSWTLYNAIIGDVSYGTMDYGNSEILTVTLTISYDWAVLQPTTQQQLSKITPDTSPLDAKVTVPVITNGQVVGAKEQSYTGQEVTSENKYGTARLPITTLGTQGSVGIFNYSPEAQNLARTTDRVINDAVIIPKVSNTA